MPAPLYVVNATINPRGSTGSHRPGQTDAVAAFSLGDGGLDVFASAAQLAGYAEAMDVEDGEYLAAWLHDGTVLRLSAPEGPEGPVVVERTTETDLPGLLAAVRAAGGPDDGDALLDWADDQLHRAWERQWPRRPRWLARRLHGASPPRVTLH